MTTRRAVGISILAVVSLALVPSAGASARPLGVMIPSHPDRPLALHNQTQDSLNWSGYVDVAASGHKVTKVASTFKVPAVNGTTAGFAATWTGIGGYNSNDLIQAGVEEDYVPGLGKTYNAWYEMLPDAEIPISNCSGSDVKCTVTPGDVMTVTIQAGTIQTAQPWTITITDGSKWSWTKSVTYTSTYSSAEWVLEAPTVGAQTVMPMMQTTLFDPNNSYAIDNGAMQVIRAGNPVRVTMNNYEGIPSALDADGDGFNACAYKLSCSAPAP